MRRLALLPAVVLLAACGGGSAVTHSSAPKPIPKPASTVGPNAHTLYEGGDWAVVIEGTKAVALHLVGGTWRPDRTNRTRVSILGPKPGSSQPTRPQVAVEITGRSRLIESAIWVDGVQLLAKGGGLKPDQGTIYGALDGPLPKGEHVAVAYGRTATTGTAVGWTFRVK